ncbi:MAG: LPS biosynthesis protein WbpP [Ardenticatenia bacterium]|jgi:UDP-glucose 4-epimerase|nr:MAG: LPS biosynthesis protein WbpP [Ardenticatenia bacterium]
MNVKNSEETHCYLVTGGAGFIGSHLVEELVRRRQYVRVLDNFSSGRRENLAHLAGHVKVIEGDICDLATVRQAMEGVDYVLHQAALVSVPGSVADPLKTDQVNVRGTLNVLLAARDAHVRRVVFASSCAVYGDNPVLPKDERMPPEPLSPYAVSKLAGEGYCRVFHYVYGLPTVVLRYFNVFGPRQDPHSPYAAVIPKFIHSALHGRALTVFGDGQQSRDFVYVANVVAANLLACQTNAAVGHVINVASGQSYSLLELIDHLKGILDENALQVNHMPPQPGDIRHSQADIQCARQLLGYVPQIDFATGLRETVAYFRQQMLRSD